MDRIPHLRRWVVGVVIVAVLVVATGASARPEGTVVLRIATNGVVTGSQHLRCHGRCWMPFAARRPRHNARSGDEATSGSTTGRAGAWVRLRHVVLSLDAAVSVRAHFVGEPTSVSLSVGGPGTIVSGPKGIACGGGQFACDAEFPSGTRLRLI